MEVNQIKTKHVVLVASTIMVMFVALIATNNSFATSINMSKADHQDQTTPIPSTTGDSQLTIQDNESLEVKGEQDDNMFEAESDDEDKSIDPLFTNSIYITPTSAKSIASNFISAKIIDAKSVSFEGEDGVPIYSVEIVKNGQSYEVNIDAINGNVLTVS